MARPITDTLRHIEGGCFMDSASEQLAELVQAVESTGKAGSITLKIDLRRATAGALAVKGKITVKKPESAPMEALLFPTPEGNLLTEDPRQHKLPLTPVAVEKTDLKQVS